MNLADRAIATVMPGWALRRARARYMLQAFNSAYEATRPGRLRKSTRDYGSGDAITRRASQSLRAQARHLERNHDIARNALRILVQNIIGARGISIEPQPRRPDGEIDTELARELTDIYRDWAKRPEVTWEHDWASTQRLLCNSWLRDGEVLAQLLSGRVRYLDHGTILPFSLEMIEADQLPLWLDDESRGITQGVERNAWNRPTAYHLLKAHPGDYQTLQLNADTKRVTADRLRHIKMVDRIGQARGVSIFAAVLTRLEDIKDYEESERVAAKVAASMAAVIKKGTPDLYNPPDDDASKPRRLKFAPGMIFDDLRPGEDIETIDSKRPNPNVESYREGQLRAASGGVGVSFSSLAKNYNGTYSAQRQELVEQFGAYELIGMEFVNQFIRPTWQSIVQTAAASGLIDPRRVAASDLSDALYILPSMPWIDPKKEADAWRVMERAGYMSAPEIIRKRGAVPDEVMEQISTWREKAREKNVALSTDPEQTGERDDAQDQEAKYG